MFSRKQLNNLQTIEEGFDKVFSFRLTILWILYCIYIPALNFKFYIPYASLYNTVVILAIHYRVEKNFIFVLITSLVLDELNASLIGISTLKYYIIYLTAEVMYENLSEKFNTSFLSFLLLVTLNQFISVIIEVLYYKDFNSTKHLEYFVFSSIYYFPIKYSFLDVMQKIRLNK